MSNYSQFFQQGDSFSGEMIAGPSTVWGGNPVFGDKEYLLTGLLKSYSSDYSSLFQQLPTACVANETTSVSSSTNWYGYYYADNLSNGYFNYSPPSLYSLGGNLHLHYPMLARDTSNSDFTPLKYGSSFSATPSGEFPLRASDFTADSILFNSRIFVRFKDNSLSQDYIYSSTGAAYSSSYTGSVPLGTFAASPSLIINAGSINSDTLDRIITSSDGVSWTDRTSNLNLGTIARLFYSTAASAFFYINTTGDIYTSTDGYTWTSRTKPTGMPAVTTRFVSFWGSDSTSSWVDTPTASYVLIGSGYMLKITGLTTYQLINLGTTGSGNLVGLFSGTGYINYNGTYIYMTNGRLRAYSTDGIDWTLDTQLYSSPYGSYNILYPIRNFVDSNVYYAWTNDVSNQGFYSIPFDYTSKSFGSTPDLVGTTSSIAFATGSNLSTYFRIK